MSELESDCEIFLKNDGASGSLYGGNKVRKLEFLLADAARQGRSEVITFGVAGSNHALATALYAEQQGLRCISILTPQTNAGYVAKNLLAALSTNAELHHYSSESAARLGARYQQLRHRHNSGIAPLIIAGGGSSPLGTVGFVNAGLELSTQIDHGVLPEPDRLYVALGTMGTAAGLLLGLRACGRATEVVPVRVVRDDIGNLAGMQRLFAATNTLLHEADPAFPLLDFDVAEIRHEQFGRKYAVFTEDGMAAKQLLAQRCGIALEGTYTAKAVAALLADRDAGRLAGKNVLYWHTYNAVDLRPRIAGLDYRELPRDFHQYFERPVQPLDA
ncbi:MAG: pyridoxal-phosphate dependent enzyme [Gammaproteobacteria bacterium]|nr:pyridoxal-phosphate dependent enzyme [Gammaproteobacteria bacterium]